MLWFSLSFISKRFLGNRLCNLCAGCSIFVTRVTHNSSIYIYIYIHDILYIYIYIYIWLISPNTWLYSIYCSYTVGPYWLFNDINSNWWSLITLNWYWVIQLVFSKLKALMAVNEDLQDKRVILTILLLLPVKQGWQ